MSTQATTTTTRQQRIEAHPLYSALSLIDPLLAGLRPMRDGDRVVFVPQPRDNRLDIESCLRELRARVERILLDVD